MTARLEYLDNVPPRSGAPLMASIPYSERVLTEARGSIGYDPSRSQVTLDTANSMARLLLGGFNAKIAYTDIPSHVSAEVEQQVLRAVTERERLFPVTGFANDLFDLDGAQGNIHPVGKAWLDQSKRAHALLVLSNPGFARLGGHATSDALHRAMFPGGKSAADLLQRKHRKEPAKAEDITARVAAFLDTPFAEDGEDRFGLTSRDYLAAVPDSKGIPKREALTMRVTSDHAKTIPDVASGKRGLVIASEACGAGNMLCKLVPYLQEQGISVDRFDALDHDPVALAVLRAHAEGSGIGDLVNPIWFNIIKNDSSQITKEADIKEALGLFEYLQLLIKIEEIAKTSLGPLGSKLPGYNLAHDFMRSLATDMKPGSMIIFGNMVESRPHQTMFNQVWPKLEQRSPEKVVEFLLSVGFPRECINVDMSDDGLYAVYSIVIPEGGLDLPPPSLWQKFIREIGRRSAPEY
jgi:hypothetical protein